MDADDHQAAVAIGRVERSQRRNDVLAVSAVDGEHVDDDDFTGERRSGRAAVDPVARGEDRTERRFGRRRHRGGGNGCVPGTIREHGEHAEEKGESR